MRKLFYIVLIGIVITMACGACEKEDPILENGITRGAAGDSSGGGGLSITITIDTAWAGDTTIYF